MLIPASARNHADRTVRYRAASSSSSSGGVGRVSGGGGGGGRKTQLATLEARHGTAALAPHVHSPRPSRCPPGKRRNRQNGVGAPTERVARGIHVRPPNV